MKFTIISDSCTNLFPRDLQSAKIDFKIVPLTLIIEDREFIDDETLNVGDFVSQMNASKACARSACPNPEAFYAAMDGCDNVIVVTITSKLSGTHASAIQAAEKFRSNYPNKKIFVLDSLTAATGIDYILFKLRDLIEVGVYEFEDIIAKIGEVQKATHVRFLIQDLSNLIKNGRLGKVTGALLSTVKIKLICGDDGAGEIKKYGMAMGTKHALKALAELAIKAVKAEDPIYINHVNNEDDVVFLKGVFDAAGYKNVKSYAMRGLSSLYSADKGIIIAY